MYETLLPVIEDTLISDNGSMPVVFEGFEHVLEKKDSEPVTKVHQDNELFYLRQGKIEFIIDGRKVIVDKGAVLVIRPNVPHSLRVITPTAETMSLHFGFALDHKSHKASQQSLDSFMEFATGDDSVEKSNYSVLAGTFKKSIIVLMERIVEERNGDYLSKELMLRILTLELMITLARALKKEWEESLRVKNGKTRELVLIAKAYSDSQYEHGITVANAASYVFLSQGYFTRAFRDEFNMSPMSYLMKKRIGKACELLENNEIKVSAVASQAGFSSPQRFNVAFRKQIGMTPLEYRKKHMH
ncbi:MAG: AraC family transcriptional regulator [Saccharofermentans sp.]|nr:AraC family transcriptional regulator [Saccharofermentans sp.]